MGDNVKSSKVSSWIGDHTKVKVICKVTSGHFQQNISSSTKQHAMMTYYWSYELTLVSV